MAVSYDTFVGAFLGKISEFDFAQLSDEDRTAVVDSYLKRAAVEFGRICVYDIVTTANDAERAFDVDIAPGDIDEIVDILSEGMVVQWLKPYLYRQEILENVLNTRDFTLYSPAELLMRVGNAHKQAQANYTQMVREYSFNHGDLTVLHL